jgi:hypothetical protein
MNEFIEAEDNRGFLRKVGVILVETLVGAIGLVGLILGGLGVLAIWLALSISDALEDANV